MGKQTTLKQEKTRKTVMSVVLAFICVIYMLPIITILVNTFKDAGAVKSNLFALPNGETFVGFENYVTGMTAGSFSRSGRRCCSISSSPFSPHF